MRSARSSLSCNARRPNCSSVPSLLAEGTRRNVGRVMPADRTTPVATWTAKMQGCGAHPGGRGCRTPDRWAVPILRESHRREVVVLGSLFVAARVQRVGRADADVPACRPRFTPHVMPAKAGIQGRKESIHRRFYHRIPAKGRWVKHSAGSGDPAYN